MNFKGWDWHSVKEHQKLYRFHYLIKQWGRYRDGYRAIITLMKV